MDQAVENGVSEGGVADELVPLINGNLAGDDGAFEFMTVFDDFEKEPALLVVKGIQAKIIEDEDIGALEGMKEFDQGTVGLGDKQFFKESGQTKR